MFLLLLRTSALMLLLTLTAGLETTATDERGLTCPQVIPAELIRDLWSRTRQLIKELPKEEKSSRRLRLLPKFCTKCPEHAIGWLEMRQVIDVYQRSVFSKEVVQKLLPPHYNELLYRLQHTLHHCVSSSKSSKWFKIIKKLERKIKKRRDEGVRKAVGEFTFVLRWIDELAQRHIL
ncbi:interleukin-26 [Chaetodon auriga]|uniref:interleukin-26 n=1 Tax=Chaetodon auriga TaxID=39042 RepID=UPI004032BC74